MELSEMRVVSVPDLRGGIKRALISGPYIFEAQNNFKL